MPLYRARLERDLNRWQEQGFLTEAGAAAIRADVKARASRGPGAAGIFAILGAVLFGFAVMSFVAANWDGLSKLARLVLLLAALWACYAGAGVLLARKLSAFAHAAILGGITVYGGSIMLIAQMYHMEGNPPDAVLLWAVGALLAAFLARSPPALATAVVLGAAWSFYERSVSEIAHLAYLPFWALTAVAAIVLRWRPGLHLSALSLAVWLAPLGYLVLDRHAHWIVVLIGLAAAAATSLGAREVDARIGGPVSAPLFVYAIATVFAGLFILQFLDDRSNPGLDQQGRLVMLVLLALLTLGLLLAAMIWGVHTDNAGALWLAYIGFAVEIFTLYMKTFGSLLNTSLFFLVAAVLVSGLAWLAYRLHNRPAQTASA